MKGGATVLFSGGMDSAVCMAMAKQFVGSSPLGALFIDYGQQHKREELAAARSFAKLGASSITHRQLRCGMTGSLVTPRWDVKKGKKSPGISQAFVPGRNLHFLTMAAAHAKESGHTSVWIGCCRDDLGGFPDCSPAFIEAAELTVRFALDWDGYVKAPLLGLTKGDVVLKGRELGVDLEATWSCYTPKDGQPCGECDACEVRARGFQEADRVHDHP